MTNDFIYSKGALCYMFERQILRVMLLQDTVSHETDIDIPRLLCSSIPGFNGMRNYRFRPIYHAEDIVSCLYTNVKAGGNESWLIVWDLQGVQCLHAHRLDSARRIFVRNNRKFLYFGTRAEVNTEKRWVLRGLDLEAGTLLPERVVLWDFFGTDIGSTICFEIFDGYLYGASSQCAFEPGNNKWNSFYYAFRFLLEDHSTTQVLPRSALWRRQGTDGPIDDRWSSLELTRDEHSGTVVLYESRKEWLLAESKSQRTCYRKEIHFPPQPQHDNDFYGAFNASTFSDPADWDSEAHKETRSPDSLHFGDEGLSNNTYTFNNSPVPSYNTSCRAFMDMVNDPPAADPHTRRLRLRVRPRPQRTPTPTPAALRTNTTNINNGDDGIRFWPLDQDSQSPEPDVDLLYRIMNPYNQVEGVDWAADERFLIYAPRRANKADPKTVILVAFDPCLHLHGLRNLYIEGSSPPCCQKSGDGSNISLSGKPQGQSCMLGCNIVHSRDQSAVGVKKETPEAKRGLVERQPWSRQSTALYQIINGMQDHPCGVDLSYRSNIAVC